MSGWSAWFWCAWCEVEGFRNIWEQRQTPPHVWGWLLPAGTFWHGSRWRPAGWHSPRSPICAESHSFQSSVTHMIYLAWNNPAGEAKQVSVSFPSFRWGRWGLERSTQGHSTSETQKLSPSARPGTHTPVLPREHLPCPRPRDVPRDPFPTARSVLSQLMKSGSTEKEIEEREGPITTRTTLLSDGTTFDMTWAGEKTPWNLRQFGGKTFCIRAAVSSSPFGEAPQPCFLGRGRGWDFPVRQGKHMPWDCGSRGRLSP